MVAVALIGSAIVGGVGTAIASGNAASAQEKATKTAANTQTNMYNTTRSDLMPYQTAGQNSLTGLNAAANATPPSTLQTFDPSQSWLESTPGYNFNLQQGLKGVQNSAAARGLGVSGAALKGASTYATGLANSTYLDQLNSYLTQQNQSYNQQVNNQSNTYNRLLGTAQLGESAAAQTGAYGTQAATGVANSQIQSGNAQAAGDLGQANALTGATNSIGNLYLLNALSQSQGGTGLFGNNSSSGSGN